MQYLYIVSKYRITYMEEKKIIWIHKLENAIDYKETIKHLKKTNARYEIAK